MADNITYSDQSTPGVPIAPSAQNITVKVEQQPDKVTAPLMKGVLDKLSAFPTTLASSMKSIFSMDLKDKIDVDKEVRSDILRINNQMILTQKLIEQNRKNLEEISIKDKSVANILKTVSGDQMKIVEDIQKRVLAGEAIGVDETHILLSSLEELTSAVSESKVSFEVKYVDIVTHLEDLINNDDIDRDDRRSMIEELIKISKSADIQNKLSEGQKTSLQLLEEMSKKNLNFTESESENIAYLLQEIKDQDVPQVKLSGTLDKLSKQLDSAILTNEELQYRLTKPEGDTGKTLKELLEKSGISGVGQTIKGGLIDFMLAQVGLGGLGIGEAASEALSLSSLVAGKGKFANIGSKAGGLLSKIPGLGGLAGGAGTVGGIAASAASLIGPAMAAYGSLSNAFDMFKVGPEKWAKQLQAKYDERSIVEKLMHPIDSVTAIGQRATESLMDWGFDTYDSISNFMSKLSISDMFGKIVNKISDGFHSVFGKDSIISKAVDFLLNVPKMIFSNIKQLLEDPMSFAAKIGDSFKAIGDFLFDENIGIFSADSLSKALRGMASTILPSFVVDKIFGAAETTPATSVTPKFGTDDVMARKMVMDSIAEDRRYRDEQLAAAKQTKVAPVVIPPENRGSNKYSDRVPAIDDLGLSIMNAGMVGV